MIYICIPSHDEETTIGVLLWKIRRIMAELPRDYQLLVADDGSTDKTGEVLEPYTRVLPLTVMRTEERRGYAASLEMLLREAVRRSDYPKRDVIIVLQADFTQDPDHLPNLIKRIESGADIVVSEAVGAQGASRRDRWASSLLRRLVRGMDWPETASDPLTGYNAYRLFSIKRALEGGKGERLLTWEGQLANAELLRAAAAHARRVDSVEFVLRPDRRQRATRSRFLPGLRGVLAFRRGAQPSATIGADRLTPSSVVGVATKQRSLVVESLRDGVGAGARKSGGRRSGTTDSGKRRRRKSKAGTEPASGGTKKRRPDSKSDRSGSGPKRRKSSGKAPGKSAETSPGQGAADDTKDAAEPRARRRSRGRRGGRRRRRSGPKAGPSDGQATPNKDASKDVGEES